MNGVVIIAGHKSSSAAHHRGVVGHYDHMAKSCRLQRHDNFDCEVFYQISTPLYYPRTKNLNDIIGNGRVENSKSP